MPTTDEPNETEGDESVYREYVLGVRIVEARPSEGDGPEFRFEAPEHVGRAFDHLETATLYADVYFDANGFQEAGTGERGVPPEVIQAGKDTLAAYFLTQPGIDTNWMASFYGVEPTKIDRYVEWVRERAEEIRTGIAERESASGRADG